MEDNYDYVDLHLHWKYNISLSDYNKNRFCGNKNVPLTIPLILSYVKEHTKNCFIQLLWIKPRLSIFIQHYFF